VTDEELTRGWQSWHEARLRATMAPLGLASLTATHWLTPVPTSYEGIPGQWRADDASIVGEASALDGMPVLERGEPVGVVSGASVALLPGHEIAWGKRRLRHFERDGSLALRLYDPSTPARALLRDIDAYAPGAEWAVRGRFIPATAGERLELTAIDGYVGEEPAAGLVEFELFGQELRLRVTGGPNGLKAIFGDTTNRDETYAFRFLTIGAPDASGHVTVDFNRSYLPPCAFSDFYVCQLPPAGNRLPVPVRAGEKGVVRAR